MKQNSLFITLFISLFALIILLAGGITLLRLGRLPAEPAAANPLPTMAATIPTQTVAPPPTITNPAAPPDTTPTENAPAPAATPAPTGTPAQPASPTSTPAVYRVQEGDTLTSIAAEFSVTVEAIMAANGLTETSILQIDQPLVIPAPGAPPAATVVLATPTGNYTTTLVGRSQDGWPIWSHIFGDGPTHLVFVGGIHGGYEWNTVTLAFEMIRYFEQNPAVVPENITLHIIPNANPDGVYLITGKTEWITANDVTVEDTAEGRFNGRGVDLNRNWPCNWSEEAFWRDRPVDPGTAPFSEPENVALRDYFQEVDAQAVIFWHSALGIVAPGRCDEDHTPSEELAQAYGQAANYPVQPFTAYDVTGDASDWLASQGIPSASVELTDHDNIEWDRNLQGVLAVLQLYANAD